MQAWKSYCAAALLLTTGSVFAQSFTVENGMGPVGSAVSVAVSYDNGGSTADGLEAELLYDSTNLTADVSACGGFPNALLPDVIMSCTDDGAGTITFIGNSASGSTAMNGSFGTIAFTIVAGPGPYTLDLTNEVFADDGGAVAAGTSTDGTITIAVGPVGAFTLTPATLNLSALQGGAAATGSITVANSGNAALTGVSCTYAGDAEITVAPFTTDLAAGASGTAAASCASATAATYTGTYSCAAGAIVGSSAVSCEVGPASAMAASTPATGSTITVSNVLAGGSSNGQILFAETNDQGVAYTVDSCAFTTGAAFAVTSTFPVAVAAGGSAAVGFSASAPADGTTPANDTLTCTTSTAQTFTFTTAITVRPPPPEVIPTLSQWAMMLMALVLAGFAGLSLRARKDFDV